MERRSWLVLLLIIGWTSGFAGTGAKGDDSAKPPDGATKQTDKAAPEKGDAKQPETAGQPKAAGTDAKAGAATDDSYDLYQAFADTLDQVERNYVKKVNRRELMEAAIHGVLSKLDPYSNYIGPEDLGRFKVNVENQFGGIGISIGMDRDQIRVLSPIVGSPAYRAGVQSGDAIVEVDGASTEGMSIDEVVRRLKGETGVNVSFTVIHPGTTKKEVLTIKREVIHVETVLGDTRNDKDLWDFMLDHERKIGYVRITGFSRDTAQELKAALADLSKRGLKGLIIDLRNNPGGLLTSAIEISDMFISEGRIVSTQGRNTPERSWDATREGAYVGFPIAILVNRFSASASEIFSACLQDHQRAVVIGERTWGKGSVQNIIDLEDGRAALKLTTASYRRPSGKNIHRFPDAKETDEWGVHPDKGYELRLGDREMVELNRYRRDRDILRRSRPKDDTLAVASVEPAQVATPVDAPSSNNAEAKPNDGGAEPAKPSDGAAKSPDSPVQSPDSAVKSPASGAPAENAPSGEKATGEKPAGEKAMEAEKHAPFVDRQLQKALEYLTQTIAPAK